MAYPHTPFVKVCRAIGVPIFKFLMSTLCEVHVYGRENVPPYGAYFIAMNHVDTLDAPLIVVFWPDHPEGLTASKNFNDPFLGTLMRMYGAISLKNRSEYDREALTQGLAVIKAGSPLVVAPEGTRRRHPGMQTAKPGIAFLAIKANVPIVPVGITGTETWIPSWKKFRRPKISLTIGQPFRLPAEPVTPGNRRAKINEYTTLIMTRIAQLLPLEYRGVYA
jgi:1-acyl-sn-glycerol-3-phosphate acyltransferase